MFLWTDSFVLSPTMVRTPHKMIAWSWSWSKGLEFLMRGGEVVVAINKSKGFGRAVHPFYILCLCFMAKISV